MSFCISTVRRVAGRLSLLVSFIYVFVIWLELVKFEGPGLLSLSVKLLMIYLVLHSNLSSYDRKSDLLEVCSDYAGILSRNYSRSLE